tara:strand:- start:505 stop:1803 length:1299 start_codon:yes stop_codon:yes gene_type:complete
MDERKNVKSLLKKRLGQDLLSILERISQVASRSEVTVFAVGGFVRDLLLNILNKDIDIVVEGDAILFASKIAEEFDGKVKSHEKFGTSVVIFPSGYRIDLAMARVEYYEYPAALPTIKESSINLDLSRRDFTINSLAIKLNGEGAFCLIDFFNGERDLKNKEIHVLHDLSFIDDPCRLFRAIKFEQRLNFKISKQTEELMKVAIKKDLVDSLSGTRLLNEITLILKEKDPLKHILRMKEFDLLKLKSSLIILDSADFGALERIATVLSWTETIFLPEKPEVWYVYLLAIIYSLKDEEFMQIIEKFQMQARLKKSLIIDRRTCKKALELLAEDEDWGPEVIYQLFSELSIEALIYFLAVDSTDRANQYANIYFSQYCGQAELSLTGDDLVKMGLKPGPVFQSVFKALREAHVKGDIETRDDEVGWVKKEFLKQ